MNLDFIESRFKDVNAKVDGRLVKTAVMVLLKDEKDDCKVIVEKRALNLKRQPGDICLPGGRIDDKETPKECAIRECLEELNIKSGDIEVIGEMDPFITPYGMIMYIFIGKIDFLPQNPSKAEVDKLYEISVKDLMKIEPIMKEVLVTSIQPEDFPYDLIHNGKNYKFSKIKLPQYFYKFDEFTIWGYTARILNEFIKYIK